MTFTISGFGREQSGKRESIPSNDTNQRTLAPRKSVVQVSFPGRGGTLAYYNGQFDLKVGDRVYVEGKLEGQLGYVAAVNYSFRIKLSEYKRVIALVDTHVHGQFYIADSHFLTFAPSAIPAAQVTTWFKAPTADDEEYASGSDGTSFRLDNLQEMYVSNAIAERGHNYFIENRVRYLCLSGAKGYANLAKFSQNENARQTLLSTGNKILAGASPYDTIWGIGMEASDPNSTSPAKWNGKNLLGKALMRVRDALKSK